MFNLIWKLISGLHKPNKTRKEFSLENLTHLQGGATCKFIPSNIANASEAPTILIVPGWTSAVYTSTSYQLLHENLHRCGFNTCTLSLRGHEGSSGDIELVTRNDHCVDISEAMLMLRSRTDIDPRKISAVGVSYGGYLLANGASELGLNHLVFRAPALYPDGDWDAPTRSITDNNDVKEWRKSQHGTSDNEVLAAFHLFPGPTMIVHSELDESMPLTVTQSYASAASRTLHIETIAGAGHTLQGTDRNLFAELAAIWLQIRYR